MCVCVCVYFSAFDTECGPTRHIAHAWIPLQFHTSPWPAERGSHRTAPHYGPGSSPSQRSSCDCSGGPVTEREGGLEVHSTQCSLSRELLKDTGPPTMVGIRGRVSRRLLDTSTHTHTHACTHTHTHAYTHTYIYNDTYVDTHTSTYTHTHTHTHTYIQNHTCDLT